MKKPLKRIVKTIGLKRHHLTSARMFCERHALATMTALRPATVRSTGRILCYHSVGQPATGVNDVTPARFRRQIELALSYGFRFVPAIEIARTGGSPSDLAITFDDAWSTVSSQAAPILKDYGIPWVLFVVPSWSDHKAAWARDSILPWQDIDRLMTEGAEIGSHSATHPDFGLITPAQMVDELAGSRETIKQRLGVAPATFAIPYGQSMNWPSRAAELAREAGYEFVYAQAEETRPSGTVPRTFVTSFDDDRIFSALLRGTYDRWEERV